MTELGGVSLSVLLVLEWKGGLVRANAVSRLASSRVLVGGLEPRLLGGDDDGLASGLEEADDPAESNLPIKVHRFLFGAVVGASGFFFSSLAKIAAASVLLNAIELRLFVVPC